ncbi:DUF1488 family protein [Caballeronia grimmiae]|uniref:DUF1488 family protein n=1 Tax=Caballeronia grimmiae TaxID=1071679 RepID=UPI0038BB87C0
MLVPEARISADKQTLSFTLDWRGQTVTCVMPRKCLEVFFWLPPDADDARMVSVFGDGFARIEAATRRKLLAQPTQTLRLTHADFSTT